MRLPFLTMLATAALIASAAVRADTGLVTPPVKPPVPAKIAGTATTAAMATPAAPTVSAAPAKPGTATTAALATPPAPAVPAAPAKPGPETTGSGKLSLSAVVANGAKPVKETVSWTVSRPAKSAGLPDEVVTTKQAAAPKIALPPGRYRVTAQYGLAKAVQDVDIVDGDNAQALNLKAGTISLKLVPTSGAAPAKDGVQWELYRYTQGKVDEAQKIASALAPTQFYILTEGAYTVRARFKDVTADLVIPVTAGINYNYTVNLYAGQAIVVPLLHQTNRPYKDEVTWEVYRANANTDGSHDLIARHTGQQTQFMLREGSYLVKALAPNLAGEAPLDIKAGKTQKITVTLKKAASG